MRDIHRSGPDDVHAVTVRLSSLAVATRLAGVECECDHEAVAAQLRRCIPWARYGASVAASSRSSGALAADAASFLGWLNELEHRATPDSVHGS